MRQVALIAVLAHMVRNCLQDLCHCIVKLLTSICVRDATFLLLHAK